MSTEVRVYDNEHGDPVVVMVTTGSWDVSRLVGLLNSGRCEDVDTADHITRAVRRHRGGRTALRVLAAHGGPDLLEPVTSAEEEIANLQAEVARHRRDVEVLVEQRDAAHAEVVRLADEVEQERIRAEAAEQRLDEAGAA